MSYRWSLVAMIGAFIVFATLYGHFQAPKYARVNATMAQTAPVDYKSALAAISAARAGDLIATANRVYEVCINTPGGPYLRAYLLDQCRWTDKEHLRMLAEQTPKVIQI